MVVGSFKDVLLHLSHTHVWSNCYGPSAVPGFTEEAALKLAGEVSQGGRETKHVSVWGATKGMRKPGVAGWEDRGLSTNNLLCYIGNLGSSVKVLRSNRRTFNRQ